MADQMRIKQDPDVGSLTVDDDLDESTDLEFYDPSIDNLNKMYLARLPNYLWEAWSKLDDDAEIQIGRVRQWTDKDGVMVSSSWTRVFVSSCADCQLGVENTNEARQPPPASRNSQGVQHGARKYACE